MSDFPTSQEEFYALRDDRTNGCISTRVYQSAVCAVVLSPEIAQTLSGQVMFLAAANLLSRWCRAVTLIVPPIAPHPLLGLGMNDLAEATLSQMRDADPFGAFGLSTSPVTSEITLLIGRHHQAVSAPMTVFIDSAGWLASIGYDSQIKLPITTDKNCLGAVAAACLGVAQMFKTATGVPVDRYFRRGIFDLFSLQSLDGNATPQSASWPSDLSIGRALMVGAGSVGSAAAYCMKLAGLTGSVTITDKDLVKIENFNRSPIFGRATFGLTKSAAVARFLRGTLLTSESLPLWWNEFAAQRERNTFDFDVWLPLANEFNVRFSMQNNFPPLMIHASTTANWGINHGRHMPGKDDCLADRFPVQISKEELTCATGQVETENNDSVDAALPFSSLFAGLLIVADLVRAQLPGYPQVSNFALFDWHGAFDNIQSWDRLPRPGCICTQQSRAIHARFNRDTKYWGLFGFA
jgi:hypothetical protein